MIIADIRTGLKDRLSSIPGLRCYDVVPDKPELPCAVVRPDEPFVADYQEAMQKGLAQVRFRVDVIVQGVELGRAQQALDAFISSGTGETSSVAGAIETDRTLGSTVSTCVVERCENYGRRTINDVDSYLGCEFVIRAHVGRT